jgi:excisionase family DNA binding protein
MTAPLYVTVGDAADILGVSATTIVRMFDEGLIDGHVLPSGHRRINAESLAAIREQGKA